jgi:hypothetical protein
MEAVFSDNIFLVFRPMFSSNGFPAGGFKEADNGETGFRET